MLLGERRSSPALACLLLPFSCNMLCAASSHPPHPSTPAAGEDAARLSLYDASLSEWAVEEELPMAAPAEEGGGWPRA